MDDDQQAVESAKKIVGDISSGAPDPHKTPYPSMGIGGVVASGITDALGQQVTGSIDPTGFKPPVQPSGNGASKPQSVRMGAAPPNPFGPKAGMPAAGNPFGPISFNDYVANNKTEKVSDTSKPQYKTKPTGQGAALNPFGPIADNPAAGNPFGPTSFNDAVAANKKQVSPPMKPTQGSQGAPLNPFGPKAFMPAAGNPFGPVGFNPVTAKTEKVSDTSKPQYKTKPTGQGASPTTVRDSVPYTPIKINNDGGTTQRNSDGSYTTTRGPGSIPPKPSPITGGMPPRDALDRLNLPGTPTTAIVRDALPSPAAPKPSGLQGAGGAYGSSTSNSTSNPSLIQSVKKIDPVTRPPSGGSNSSKYM